MSVLLNIYILTVCSVLSFFKHHIHLLSSPPATSHSASNLNMNRERQPLKQLPTCINC